MNGLAGKVAVVTGGGSGIGEAAARRLAAEGASVVVVDVDGERATRTAGELGQAALGVAADVSAEDGVGRYMDAAVERFGRIDAYHLNAGISGDPVRFPDVTAEDFDRVLDVNVRGVFLGLRAAFRQFARQDGGGAIVTTASICSFGGGADLVPYHVSKHALVGLTRSAAVYGGPLGIRVNAIAPGIVPTNLLGAAAGDGRRHIRYIRPGAARADAAAGHCRRGRRAGRVPAQRRCIVRQRGCPLRRRWRGRRQSGPSLRRLTGAECEPPFSRRSPRTTRSA